MSLYLTLGSLRDAQEIGYYYQCDPLDRKPCILQDCTSPACILMAIPAAKKSYLHLASSCFVSCGYIQNKDRILRCGLLIEKPTMRALLWSPKMCHRETVRLLFKTWFYACKSDAYLWGFTGSDSGDDDSQISLQIKSMVMPLWWMWGSQIEGKGCSHKETPFVWDMGVTTWRSMVSMWLQN